jgi:hypothetical protein
MKIRYSIFILLFSISANAQELVLNNTIYGQVTSTLYKEARIVRPIAPAQFHELSVLFDGYRLNFKYVDDYTACFSAYPKIIDWELTDEELRNLRNFIRRYGGTLPKISVNKVSSHNDESTNESTTTQWYQETVDEPVYSQEQPLSNPEIAIEEDTRDIISTSKDSTAWSNPPNDQDSTQSLYTADAITTDNTNVKSSNTINNENGDSAKKMDQMRAYKRKGVIYRNDTLSVKQAKLIAMNQNFTAYRHFAAAQRIRGWNTFWGIVTVPAYPIVIITGPAIAVRESIRKRRIEKAVEAYNISIIKENNGDIKKLVR